MLNTLHIKNFALIEDANISFREGFSVITGETGAGKSIMLDALGLLLGKRAEISVLRESDKKCVIEGEFNLEGYQLESFFEQEDLDFETITIVRREIGKNGKSRAFVNDTPVVLSLLKKLGGFLIDVHSQNANVLLNSDDFYFDLLDGVAGSLNERKAYKLAYEVYLKKQKKLSEYKEHAANAAQELDFKQFQLNELKTAQIQEGEQQRLEEELLLLGNAEEIKTKISEASELLHGGSGAVLEKVALILQNLKSLSQLGNEFESLGERIDSTLIELEDIHAEIQSLNTKVEVDPAALQAADDRLGTLFSLVKKFSVLDSDGLLEKQKELEQEVQLVLGGDEEILALQEELEKQEKKLKSQAELLSKKRKKASEKLQLDILGDLQAMNMTNSRLEIQLNKITINQYGCDEVKFLFNANKGGALQALSKVASGGEFSRIMLSLKRILSAKKELPTILFDEIDTGVSGDVADKMAKIMQEMSKGMQVISITHLPQIAAKGAHHFKVHKTDAGNATRSHVELLSPEDRVKTIAQMLSGTNVSTAAVDNARDLLEA